MRLYLLKQDDPLWSDIARFAACCSWKAGPSLAREMRRGAFSDWERVIAALDDDGSVMGYCTLARTDCIPDVPYTPYIGYMFVGEEYRGHRLSGKMIRCAAEYAAALGFRKLYLCSRERGLYEKYGFVKLEERSDRWGSMEQIFSLDL